MAIAWDFTIEVIDKATKRAQITGTRTDSADPGNVLTFTGAEPLEPHDGETLPQMRDRIAAEFYGYYTAHLAEESAVAAIVSDYEDQLKTATEALEV